MMVLGISRGGSRPARLDQPLDRDVVRIGSHAHCPIRFPELEPHAITLERRAGGYVVHNRTQRVLGLGDIALPAGGQAAWPKGVELRLRSDLVMTLDEVEVDTGRRDGPRRISRPVGASGGGASGNLILQLAVIAACLAGTVSVLVGPAGVPIAAEDEARLIGDLMVADPLCRSVGHHLRQASRARRLGDLPGERAHYQRARNLLMASQDRSGDDEQLCRRALRFVAITLARR